jgi:lipopolysaccharide export system permease protein
MTILTRYLLRQNLFLVLTILLGGTGLYLLTDLFERLDNFLEADVSAGLIIGFFLLSCPLSFHAFCLRFFCWPWSYN